MSSSLSIPELTGSLAPRRALVARTVPAPSVDARTRDAAFALFRASYENTSRERFEHDFAEKQHVILLHDRESGDLKGFSTVLVREIMTERGPGTLIFSGDTVIDREYWGQKQLQLAFVRLLTTLKLRAPRRPLRWFLLSKGYRTYLLLANAFPRSVPRAGVQEDAPMRAMLDELALERYGDQYDATAGVVRYASPHERVRAGVAPVTPDLLDNRHVRFFVERNPAHVEGVELACLADVRLLDVGIVAMRLAVTRTLRMLGARRGAR
jgi:hypothetical protein